MTNLNGRGHNIRFLPTCGPLPDLISAAVRGRRATTAKHDFEKVFPPFFASVLRMRIHIHPSILRRTVRSFDASVRSSPPLLFRSVLKLLTEFPPPRPQRPPLLLSAWRNKLCSLGATKLFLGLTGWIASGQNGKKQTEIPILTRPRFYLPFQRGDQLPLV